MLFITKWTEVFGHMFYVDGMVAMLLLPILLIYLGNSRIANASAVISPYR